MKQLILMRHGKSSWDDPSLEDFQRPLANRGMRDCKKIGKWLSQNALKPDLILCSPALRCQQSFFQLPKSFVKKGLHQDDRALYHASHDELIRLLTSVNDNVDCVLLLGHNTGLLDLAVRLSQYCNLPEGYFGKFPTSAISMFGLKHQHWKDVGSKQTKLCWYMTPKKLKTKTKRDLSS